MSELPFSIQIKKSKKILELYREGVLLREYEIGLGRSALGHKREEGDHRTPEGDYFICDKNPKSQSHLSLGISYPNSRDAEQALWEGRLSEEETGSIVAANQKKQRPPWNTVLGGEIYIHGGLERHPDSRGCIVMKDSQIEELFHLISYGTPIKILP